MDKDIIVIVFCVPRICITIIFSFFFMLILSFFWSGGGGGKINFYLIEQYDLHFQIYKFYSNTDRKKCNFFFKLNFICCVLINNC